MNIVRHGIDLSEVLVCLITVSQAIDADVFGRLVHELGVRMTRIAVHFVQGFDRDTKDEIIWKVEEEVMDLILSDPPCRQGEYLQIAFRNAIEQRTIMVSKRRQFPLPSRYAPAENSEGTVRIAGKTVERSEKLLIAEPTEIAIENIGSLSVTPGGTDLSARRDTAARATARSGSARRFGRRTCELGSTAVRAHALGHSPRGKGTANYCSDMPRS